MMAPLYPLNFNEKIYSSILQILADWTHEAKCPKDKTNQEKKKTQKLCFDFFSNLFYFDNRHHAANSSCLQFHCFSSTTNSLSFCFLGKCLANETFVFYFYYLAVTCWSWTEPTGRPIYLHRFWSLTFSWVFRMYCSICLGNTHFFLS